MRNCNLNSDVTKPGKNRFVQFIREYFVLDDTGIPNVMRGVFVNSHKRMLEDDERRDAQFCFARTTQKTLSSSARTASLLCAGVNSAASYLQISLVPFPA